MGLNTHLAKLHPTTRFALLAVLVAFSTGQATPAHAVFPTGTIDTVVGGSDGDGLPADVAKIDPQEIAFDANGNVLIADGAGNRIRRIDGGSWVITTIAGTGSPGFGGDNSLAVNATLDLPTGLVVDSNGDIYFSDERNHRVRRIDARTGVITTVAGNGTGSSYDTTVGDGGPATNATVYYPEGLAFLPDGSLLIADSGHARVRTVATNGIITTVAGTGSSFGSLGDNGPAVNALLTYPRDVSADAAGNYYITDGSMCRIRRVDGASQIITTIAGTGTCSYSGDGGPATSAKLNTPMRATLTPQGHLYIAEQQPRVRDINLSTGLITTIAGTGVTGSTGDGGAATHATFNLITGLGVGGSGFYIADSGNENVRLVNSDSIIETVVAEATGDGLPAEVARINTQGMHWDAAGTLYIADGSGNAVRRVDATSSIITTIAGTGAAGYGGDNNLAINAILNLPTGLVVDGNGNVYFSDERNHRVRRIDARSGVITTVAGNGTGSSYDTQVGDGGPATAAMLYYPEGLALLPNGSLLIADSGHARVRKVTTSGIISTVAGTGSSFGTLGDNGPAVNALVTYPRDVTTDAAGNYYITDGGMCRVRRVDATTQIITTVAGSGTCAFGGDGGLATAATLNTPLRAVIDANGYLYIGEPHAPRVRCVDPTTGFINTVAGTGFALGSGDGGSAAQATFGSISSLLLSGSDLYVGDDVVGSVRHIQWNVTQSAPTATLTPVPPTPTRTPTRSPTSPPASIPTRTPTWTPIPTRTSMRPPTSTPTKTVPRATATPIVGIGGQVLYYSNSLPVGSALMQLTNPPTQTQTDLNGQYTFAGLSIGSTSVWAHKAGDVGDGVSALDAVYILESLSGSRTLSAAQQIACDVTGNGSLSTLDASMILQYKTGVMSSFPVAQTCNSDWTFLPLAQSSLTVQVTQPVIQTGVCQPGKVTFSPLAGIVSSVNFSAILFGDCTGNWQSSGTGALTRALSAPAANTVRLGRPQRHGRRVRVPLVVQAAGGFQGLDIQLSYDAAALKAVDVRTAPGAQGALMAANTSVPGAIVISLASAARLPAGPVLALEFTATHAPVATASIHVTHGSVE